MQSLNKMPNISERVEAESWHQLLPRLRASLHASPGLFLPCKSLALAVLPPPPLINIAQIPMRCICTGHKIRALTPGNS